MARQKDATASLFADELEAEEKELASDSERILESDRKRIDDLRPTESQDPFADAGGPGSQTITAATASSQMAGDVSEVHAPMAEATTTN